MPVALGALTTVAAGVVAADFANNKPWIIGLALGSAAVQVYSQAPAVVQAQPMGGEDVYQTMADLKRDIIKPTRFASLF